MLTSAQITEMRGVDYKALGRFLGLVDMIGQISQQQIIETMKTIKADYVKEMVGK